MTFSIPAPVHDMRVDWDTDARARGGFAGALEAQPSTRNRKSQGSLPLTAASATAFVNAQASSATGPLRGVYWEFLATGGYDVSADTLVMVVLSQFNAPNRVQITTAANNGFVVRLGSGSGSPPTNYRTWQVGGNDTKQGSAREFPTMFVIDMNAADHAAEVGTFDNTDVQCFGVGNVRQNIIGSATTQWFLPPMFVFETVRGATNIPRFTGTSDWDDVIAALGTAFDTKISHDWLSREGNVFAVACPIEFGDGSGAVNFDDDGASVFWPDSNDPADPRAHVTSDAFRVYSNLRDNAADLIRLSGFYDCGNSYPPWDFDQDVAGVANVNGMRLRRCGVFPMGSCVTGSAVFDDCDVITLNHADADLDGSTFGNPRGDHLLSMTP